MSALDKNKIFFGMVKYILSEQNNVDWVFKTSILGYNGAKQSLTDSSSNEIMNNMIKFIYEIKPYHTQFAEFQSGYEPVPEDINVDIDEQFDFANLIRFDNVSSYPSNEFMKEYTESMDTKVPMDNKWLNTTLIERYCYLQSLKDVYLPVSQRTGLPDKKEMKSITRSDFKGTVLKGGEFISDVFGYDMLLYDTDQYDSPTIIYDYLIKDMTEPMDNLLVRFTYDPTLNKWVRNYIPFIPSEDFTYDKSIISTGQKSFSFSYVGELEKSDIQCILYKKNTDSFIIITDFSMSYAGVYQLEFFMDILDGDTLYIKLLDSSTVVNKVYVYNAMAFFEQDSYNIKRKVVPLEEVISVEEPEPNIVSKRLLIVKQTVDGYRAPFLNYTKSNGKINAYGLQDGEHLMLSAYDYQYLYDFIIKGSTDIYGRSNNTILYSGSGLLRPHFEAERPCDLCVSHGSESIIINNGIDIRHVDFKGMDSYIKSKLKKNSIKDIKVNEQGIMYAFSLENESVRFKEIPITLLINGELISASALEDGYYSKLMRCKDGTRLCLDTEVGKDIQIGDDVYLWKNVIEYEKQNLTVSYMVEDNNNKFYAPLGTKLNDMFEVSVLKAGEGIPSAIPSDEIIIGSEELLTIGSVVYEDNLIYVYTPEETLLYVIDNDNVYDGILYNAGQRMLVGMKHGKYLETLSGNRFASIKEDKLICEVFTVTIQAGLENLDVVHISTIQN